MRFAGAVSLATMSRGRSVQHHDMAELVENFLTGITIRERCEALLDQIEGICAPFV
jgi:hypothetical protein